MTNEKNEHYLYMYISSDFSVSFRWRLEVLCLEASLATSVESVENRGVQGKIGEVFLSVLSLYLFTWTNPWEYYRCGCLRLSKRSYEDAKKNLVEVVVAPQDLSMLRGVKREIQASESA